MTMVVGEMTDIIWVIAGKNVQKVGEVVTREVTKKFWGMVGW